MLPSRMNLRASLMGSTSLRPPPPIRKPRQPCIVLFGAGASAFCEGVTPNPPPLGYRLFEKLEAFNPFFRCFSGNLKEEFRRNFEVGMERFAGERNQDLPRFLCLMSLYFLQFKIS